MKYTILIVYFVVAAFAVRYHPPPPMGARGSPSVTPMHGEIPPDPDIGDEPGNPLNDPGPGGMFGPEPPRELQGENQKEGDDEVYIFKDPVRMAKLKGLDRIPEMDPNEYPEFGAPKPPITDPMNLDEEHEDTDDPMAPGLDEIANMAMVGARHTPVDQEPPPDPVIVDSPWLPPVDVQEAVVTPDEVVEADEEEPAINEAEIGPGYIEGDEPEGTGEIMVGIPGEPPENPPPEAPDLWQDMPREENEILD